MGVRRGLEVQIQGRGLVPVEEFRTQRRPGAGVDQLLQQFQLDRLVLQIVVGFADVDDVRLLQLVQQFGLLDPASVGVVDAPDQGIVAPLRRRRAGAE